MGLFGALVETLGTDREETFSYRCAECGVEFERAKTRMVGVRCPDCDSMNVRDAGEQ